MAKKKDDGFNEANFIKKNNLLAKYEQSKKTDPNIANILEKITEHYIEYSKNCGSIAEKELLAILNDTKLEKIHSARHRIKTLNSLLVKIVQKKAFLSEDAQDDNSIEKYRLLDQDNYYKIITDIMGIRILIRYREQWSLVHNWIWKKYFKGENYFLNDFVADYKGNVGQSFIVEKPKIYYRNENDLQFYESFSDVTSLNLFEFIKSKEGYNSIHYLVNVDGKYLEIQVRTILDEVWGECTHDIVYKCKSPSKKAILESLAQCLARQSIASESIISLMYTKVNTTRKKVKKQQNNDYSKKSNVTGKKYRIRLNERVRVLDNQKSNIFDGDVDALID